TSAPTREAISICVATMPCRARMDTGPAPALHQSSANTQRAKTPAMTSDRILVIKSRSREFPDRIPDANRAILNDPGVDAAQIQLDACRRVHERGRVLTEARRELAATPVGRRGHLQHGGSDQDARSGRNARRAQIEVNEQLVSGQLTSILAAGQDGDDTSIHDRDLLVWI